MHKIVILSMGRRGAGPKLAIDLAAVLHAKGIQFKLIANAGSHEFFEDLKITDFDIKFIKFRFNNLQMLFNYILQGRLLARRLKNVDVGEDDLIVTMMPSLWDIHIHKSPFNKNFILRVIHDDKRHKGDWLPTNGMLKNFFMNSDGHIFFTNYVRRNYEIGLEDKTRKTLTTKHPVFSYKDKSLSPIIEGDYALAIGRNKKYQNFEILSAKWSENSAIMKLPKLVVAGQNNVKLLSNKLNKNVIRLSHWITYDDYFSLIKYAQILFLPYTEATQSGNIPVAIHFGTPVGVLNVGGLPEQIESYERGYVADSIDGLIKFAANLNLEHTKAVNVNWMDSWTEIVNFLLECSEISK